MSDKQSEQEQVPPVRGTRNFAAFLAKARKVEGKGSQVRSTAHTSSVFVPDDVEDSDKPAR